LLSVIDGNTNSIISTAPIDNSPILHRPATSQLCSNKQLETQNSTKSGSQVTASNVTSIAKEVVHTDASTSDINYANQDLIAKCSFDEYGGIDNRKSWLKFDLPVSPSQIKHATLRHYVTSYELSGSVVDIYREDNNTWHQGTITYNNEPAHFASLSAGPFARQSISTTSQYELDVTNAVASNPNGKTITLVVVGNTLNNGISFAGSKNSSSTPELLLSY